MAIANPPAVPAKMYRHFAVITIVITLAIAMLANGESAEREAEQARAAAIARQPGASPVQAPKYGEAKMNRQDSGMGSFYGDSVSSDYGKPTDRTSAIGRDTSMAPPPPPVSSRNRSLNNAFFETLSAEEQAQLLERLRAAGYESEEELARQLEILAATSRRAR